MPRTDAQTVLSYAKAELLTAIKDLPYQYGTQTNLYYGSYGAQWQENCSISYLHTLY